MSKKYALDRVDLMDILAGLPPGELDMVLDGVREHHRAKALRDIRRLHGGRYATIDQKYHK